jgi:hypothetical protein
MRKIYLFALAAITLIGIAGCDQELPWPEVTRSVAIDIVRTPGSEPVLFDGITDGNFGVVLTIPHQQGDFSMMKHAQLLAVLNDGTTTTSRVVADNITFTRGANGMYSSTIPLDLADIYSRFGKVSPSVGEMLILVPNVVLTDETVIPGWTQLTGVNNMRFREWRMGGPDGRNFSNLVEYAVVCQLVLDDFVGTATVTRDTFWGAGYEVEITKISDNQLRIDGLMEGITDFPLILTINTEEFTVSFPTTTLIESPTFQPAFRDLFFQPGTGRIDACTHTITFETPRIEMYRRTDGAVLGWAGPFHFTIEMNR